MKKIILSLLGLVFGISILSACGSGQPATYAPAAYGVPGHCYFVNSQAEAIALQNAGLCPRSWVPTVMPLSWEEEYYPFYSSPAYYNTYVPVRARHAYVRTETTFYRAHTSSIRTASARATYRSSTGGTVRGTTIIKSKTSFGSGTSFGSSGSKYGSGSLRSRTGTGSSSGYSSRTSSRSGGGSFGGGGLRSSSHR